MGFAGRWHRESTGAGASRSKSAGKSKTNKPTKGQNKKAPGKSSKDKSKFDVLKKVLPSCKLGNWSEVTNLRRTSAVKLQRDITTFVNDKTSNGMEIKEALGQILNEEEIKLSKSFIPYLPRYQDKAKRSELAGVGSVGEDSNSTSVLPLGGGVNDASTQRGETEEEKSLGGLTGLSSRPSASDIGNSEAANSASKEVSVDGESGPGDAKDASPGTTTHLLPLKDIIPWKEGHFEHTLKEHFQRYDWTSTYPAPCPDNLYKTLKLGWDLCKLQKSDWMKMTILDKIVVLRKVMDETR